MYFRELMNGNGSCFDLGTGEIFYRKKSLDYDETHPANIPLKNKSARNENKYSTFQYPLCKDKRFMFDQFTLHLSVIANYLSDANKDSDTKNDKMICNSKVLKALRGCDDNYVIGIDRGERNLLYVSVINGKGNIVEQFSANIVEDDDNSEIKTDYHALLANRENERLEARRSWKSINGIKDLKKGYLSQVMHKICLLVEKYDAVIAMEDLNSGFKNGRKKVEKSVYQEFEKALIEKLNLLTFKDKQPDEVGGLRYAYQLTDKFESFQKMKLQNGIIFYIPAWNTSKIDPTTGFVDMLKINYTSVDSAVKFFGGFHTICYDSEKDAFVFSFDYANFGVNIDYKNKWTVYSYGDRIETFRTNNNQFDCRKVYPTDLLKKAFKKAGIAYADGHNLISDICSIKTKEFYVDIMKALRLTLQMRNNNAKTGEDYIISPVLNKQGEFFDSRKYSGKNAVMPTDADANGAYHIAQKCLWAINQIKTASEEDYLKTSISISNKEWLRYMQKGNQ
jgi:CRISPR-associated protein Cpf1